MAEQKKFLDSGGLRKVWNRINDVFSKKEEVAAVVSDTTTLKEENAQLKAEIAAMTVTKTAETKLSITRSNISFFRTGNIVMCSYTDATSSSIQAGDLGVIGTIPDGFRPSINIRIMPLLVNSSVPQIQMSFNTDGAISAYNYSSAQNSVNPFRFFVTYTAI